MPPIFSAARFAKPFDMLIAVCRNEIGADDELEPVMGKVSIFARR
jgi:hypothetical protein